mmetsp:Transcript_28646/g.60447  ORF Transcript_28646/g.60447 Transcript_28646/m.60447 type:complete len:442 (+) Transcript_28646:106-1431(+)|eukprot:CAMPEP_0183722080 /NCGR_PEP_ID=MMETSP0737-20130205/14147_1 /TAXON_ID=385413 /ORGANISM="Thalassiosira miniscula, Strain CCMP1093" /LENGTH=441 /DNA_ID=CAMNT_0025952181 /DNA_START=70 /DNA_END=1395 /DNA_ORIENTATION=+
MADEFTLSNVTCIDTAKTKSPHPISTGIGFFDHMIDQLNSHAQIGVSVTVTKQGEDNSGKDHHSFEVVNRYADEDQAKIMGAVGAALGKELNKLKYPEGDRTSRFCCPLDEALVECELTKKSNNGEGGGKLVEFTLPPYGKYPANKGRAKIGTMKTQHVETFFSNVADASGMDISLVKIRGDNGHHVVESAFKAFSRALRNLIDGTNTNNYASNEYESMWGVKSESYTSSLELCREGKLERSTKETSILVHILLNGLAKGPDDSVQVNTGIKTMDQFVSILAKEAMMSIEAKCNGDLYVDDHHTSEDVAIALGQVLNTAFGTKAGLNRMWCAVGTYGDAEVEVTMDLSNRPCITHNLSLSSNPNEEEYAGDLSIEMLDHVIESLVMNSRSTVHIYEKKVGKTVLETAMATAMAYGKALRMCASVDPRRAGKTASSKGTLSV